MDNSESCQSDYNIRDTLLRKANTISLIWNYTYMYFWLKTDPKGCSIVKECGLPVCKVCGKVIPAKGGNTSNVLTHLRDHHPEKYTEVWPKVSKKACLTKGKGFQSTYMYTCTCILCELQEHSMKYPSQSNITTRLGSSTSVIVLKSALSTFSKLLGCAYKHFINQSFCAYACAWALFGDVLLKHF